MRALLSLLLLSTVALAGDKPTFTVAVGSDWRSMMVRSELTRDWQRCNPDVYLTERQLGEVWLRGRILNYRLKDLRRTFNLRFTDEVPQGVRPPAVKVGHCPWQELGTDVFRVQGRPVELADYLRLEWEYEMDRDEETWNYTYRYERNKAPVPPSWFQVRPAKAEDLRKWETDPTEDSG